MLGSLLRRRASSPLSQTRRAQSSRAQSKQAKRSQLQRGLQVQSLEDRRLLAVLHWQGDADTSMSNPANWASDVGGTEAGVAPLAGDTLIFSTDTVGLTSFDATNDLDASVNNLIIQSVDNLDDGQSFNIGAGANPLGIVAINSSGTAVSNGATISGLTFDTSVELNADTSLTADQRVNFFGSVSGNFSINASGSNEFSVTAGLRGVFDFDGPLELNTRLVGSGGGGTPSTTPINVNAAGELSGFGNFAGPIAVAPGGTISPAFNPPLGVTTGVQGIGDLNLADGANYDIEIDGVNPGFPPNSHDQIDVTGTVTVGDVNYNILAASTYIPSVGDEFVIINNDGVDPVILGANAPAAGTIVSILNNAQMRIFYDGGDGNDVVLEPATVDFIGYKFEDIDADGEEDPGEPRLNDVFIYSDVNDNLQFDVGEPSATTATIDLNNDGNIDPATEDGVFVLEVVAGISNLVREEVAPPFGQTTQGPTPLAVNLSADPNDPEPVIIDSGLTLDPNDPRLVFNFELTFGNAVEGAIYGFKFEDLNGDGVRDLGEPALPGVTFLLNGTDGQGNVISELAVTDANGEFAFTNLFPSVNGEGQGTGYTVDEFVPAGFVATTLPFFTTDLQSREVFVYTGGNVVIDPNQVEIADIVELQFGNTVLGSIHGFKFFDANGNGVQDNGEGPQGEVEFILLVDTNGDGFSDFISDTAVSDPNTGEFSFEGLFPGSYAVSESVPPEQVPTTGNPFREFVITSGQELVWEDGAANIPGPTAPASDQSQLTGDFLAIFEAAVGGDAMSAQSITAGLTGTLTEVRLQISTTQTVGDLILEIQSLDGDGLPSGNVLGSATIAGASVPVAANQIVSFDFSAAPVQQVAGLTYALVLRSPNTDPSTPASLSWDLSVDSDPYANGVSFFSIPQTGFQLNDQGNDFFFETFAAAAPDPRQEITVGDQLIFGNTIAGSIHGFKFLDVDGNGFYDPNVDQPQANVQFSLTDLAGNPVDSPFGFPIFDSFSQFDGQFDFSFLLPGDYLVTEVVPSGFVSTTEPLSRQFTVGVGEELVWEFGAANLPIDSLRTEILNDPDGNLRDEQLIFGNTVQGSVHGFKFQDINADGQYDDLTETPLAGITFRLTGVDSRGENVSIDMDSGTDGEFDFTGLYPSVAGTESQTAGVLQTGYTLTELLPTETASTADDAFIATTPRVVGPFDLVSGQENVAIVGQSTPLFGTPIFDQGTFGTDDETIASETRVVGQRITANTAGQVADLFFLLDDPTDAFTGDLIVEIREIDGTGAITSNVLASETTTSIGAANAFDGLRSVEVVFNNAAAFESGDEYAILIRTTAGSGAVDVVTSTFDDINGNLVTSGDNVTFDDQPGELFFNLSVAPRLNSEILVEDELFFGNTLVGSIHGLKFEDVDFNGVFVDGTDTPLAGVTFTLTGTDSLGNLVEKLAITGADGQFDFEGLFPSDTEGYTVTESVPPGFVATTQTFTEGLVVEAGQELVWQDGAANLSAGDPRVEVLIDQDGNGFNEALMFGNTVFGSIHGFKFLDDNGNGIYEPDLGESPQPNVDFQLEGTFAGGGAFAQIETTNENGEFWFTDLPPNVAGTAGSFSPILATGYTVTEIVPAGFVSTTPTLARTFDLFSRQELAWETGAAGIPIQQAPVVDIEQTDSDHEHFFNDTSFLAQTFTPTITGGLSQVDISIDSATPVGDLILEVQSVDAADQPSGSVLGSVTIAEADIPADASDQTVSFDFSGASFSLFAGQQYALVLRSTASNSTVNWRASDTSNPYNGGAAFNSDDSGESWDFFLLNEDHVFTTTMQPAADPRVEVLLDTADADGLVWGNTVPGSIHGFKFEDLDGDGVYEPNFGEQPLAGVEFILTGIDGQGNVINLPTTTDMNGEFQFVGLLPSVAGDPSAAPGVDQTGYTVTETVPSGFQVTTTTPPVFNLFSGDELVWQIGAAGLPAFPGDPRVEFLVDSTGDGLGDELIFGNTIVGSLHGFKFLDINNNGTYDPAPNPAGEVPQAGVEFTLTGTLTTGEAITPVVVTTLDDGRVDFTGLLPGFYTITETVPAGFVSTTAPLARDFVVFSGEELVWQDGAAGIPDAQPAAVDQQNLGPATSFNDVGGTVQSAQTFTPAVSGGLTQVDISINATDPVGNVTLEIQTLNGAGEPSGFLLGTATVPGGSIPIGTDQTVSFDLSGAPASLVAGQSYALVLRAPTTAPTNLDWNYTTNQYAGGIIWDSGDAGATWAPFAGFDHIFTTTMLPAADPRFEVLIDFDQNGLNEELMWGNTVYGSLHGFKFEDIDGNGIYDDTIDQPLGGVTFVLAGVLADGTEIVLQDTTDALGVFEFTNLPPSIAGVGAATGYALVETDLLGFIPTTNAQSFFDLASGQEFVWQAGASDVDPQDPDDPRTEILDGQGRLIFGNTAPGSIHGFKFDDFDGDGIYEPDAINPGAGDFGQPGVTFTLEGTDSFGFVYSVADGTALTQVTNADGEFWFVGLYPSIAGQPSAVPDVLQTGYTVTEVVPTGFVPTTLPLARQFDLESRMEFVWTDGAAMLPTLPVEAVDQSVPVPGGADFLLADTTDPRSVRQTFTPAVTGTLTSFQHLITTGGVIDGDVVATIQTVDSLGNPTGAVLATSTVAAANVPLGTEVLIDFTFDVALVAGTQYAFVLTTTQTAGNVGVPYLGGNPYPDGSLTQVDGGTIVNTPNFDIAFATTMLADADPRVEFLADSNGDQVGDELMWGNTLPGEIHGFKFDDTDGNGIVDFGESRLAGFTIQLRNADGTQVTDANGDIIADQITDANGEYWFTNLLPGTYFVREVQQDGYVQTTHDPQPYVITRGQVYVAQAGQGMLDRDDPRTEIVDKCLIFGNTLTSSIFGYKFNDINADGDDEGGTDPRLEGVTITLTGDSDGDGTVDIQTRVTDATGQYAFEDIRPGTYTLTETPPTGSVATTPVSQTVIVGPGEIAVAFDGQQGVLATVQVLSVRGNELTFGNTYLGSIHGHKYIDVNQNATDENEPRLADVTITLVGDVDGDGDTDTVVTQTNATGDYAFENLFPGAYTVTETVPAGTFATTPVTANVTITSGEEAVAIAGQSILVGPLGPGQFESAPNDNLAFGNAYLGEIHGHKFEDLDADGIEDPAEPRLQGFSIELRDATGTLVATEVTDANGEYWFLNLAPGTYFVTEVQQSGYAQTTHDPQPITITGGQIYAAQLDQAEMIDGDIREVFVDKCLSFGNTITSSIHGYKFQDDNRDGLVNFTDADQAGVTFNLTTSAGAAVLDVFGNIVPPAVTGTFGRFAFENLLPGTYVVTEEVPTGQQPTTGSISRTFTIGYGTELVAIPGIANIPAGDPRVEQVIARNIGSDLDWGNAPLLGEIHGHKFSDLDGDGIEDDEDFRLNGWTIILTDAQGNSVVDAFGNTIGPVQTADMDLNNDNVIQQNERGLYWFTDLLPGTYIVTEVDQPGYEQTSHNPQPITITGGQVYVAQLDQAMTDRTQDPDDATTDDGFEEGREIIVDKCLAFGNQLRGEITWTKVNKYGNPLGGVIFGLTQTHSYDLETGNLTNIVDRPITVVDNLFPDVNNAFGFFEVHDLPLGRYTLTETFPIPGYDPDLFVETFNLYPVDSLDDRFQDADHVFVNDWSKRAFIGSTYAARIDYLEQIGMAEIEAVNGGIGDFANLDFGLAEAEPFRVRVAIGEAEQTVTMTHVTSGIVVAEGEYANPFDATTTDLDEHLIVGDLTRLRGPLRVSAAGGNDVIDISDFNFQSIDGGEGHDVLRLRQSGELSLDDVAQWIQGIEAIDVTAGGQRLSVGSDLVQKLTGDKPLQVQTGSSDQLRVQGDWEMTDIVQENGRVIQVIRSGDAVMHLVNQNQWQNALDRFDVNHDGSVTALDALVGINHLGRSGGNASLDNSEVPSDFFDVSGDGKATALDTLNVINHLARQSGGTSAEGEQAGAVIAAPITSEATDEVITRYDAAESLHDAADRIADFDSEGNGEAIQWISETGFDNDGDDEADIDLTLAMLAGDIGR